MEPALQNSTQLATCKLYSILHLLMIYYQCINMRIHKSGKNDAEDEFAQITREKISCLRVF